MTGTQGGAQTILPPNPSPFTAAPSSRVTGSMMFVAATLFVVAVLLIVGLARRPVGGIAVPGGTHVVRVDERDFQISVSRTTLVAGHYVFVDTNHGPTAHELVMWKTTDTDTRLPFGKDRINEASPDLESVLDSGTALRPGEARLLSATLSAGHYLLVCNLPGHFRAGMHVDITVQ
jgi:uncharacterized cupredoxin-like copper-binding protein